MKAELSPATEKHTVLDNPLLAAASPLMNAVVQIRQAVSHDDPAGLRQQLADEIRLFENRCRREDLPFEMIIGARYCLCAMLDEAAAQTPWGNRGVWSGNGLLVTFHNEAWGGDKFFQLLSRLSQNPDQHVWLLEVINYCLLLGYEGRYRTMDNGRSLRDAIRDRLAVLIANVRETPQHSRLSPPVELPQESTPWRPPVPLWACISITAFIACLIFSSLNWRLGNSAALLLQQIWQTPLPETVAGQRGSVSQALTDLRLRLSDLITAHQLDVVDTSSGSRVILPVDGLFNASVTSGIRAIIAAMLQSFNPQRLEEHARRDGALPRLALSASRKAALWDYFVRHYQNTSGDLEDDFHSLFGEAFLQAYEMEVNQYKDSQTAEDER